KEEVQYYYSMPLRGLTPEQIFDSVAEAIEYQEPPQPTNQQFFNPNQRTPRNDFLNRFASQEKRTEFQTSILQALFMMNNKFMTDAASPARNKALATIIASPTTMERKVETIYLLVLARAPSAEEMQRRVRYVGTGEDVGRRLSDIYWALLNSGEFLLNH